MKNSHRKIVAWGFPSLLVYCVLDTPYTLQIPCQSHFKKNNSHFEIGIIVALTANSMPINYLRKYSINCRNWHAICYVCVRSVLSSRFQAIPKKLLTIT